ncbi:hypothetical protein DFH27DRAFT_310525 [Peziza echinospora]|nr:hypothetical protein DFH27DRAFT_310525 [Peziza echinospora]
MLCQAPQQLIMSTPSLRCLSSPVVVHIIRPPPQPTTRCAHLVPTRHEPQMFSPFDTAARGGADFFNAPRPSSSTWSPVFASLPSASSYRGSKRKQMLGPSLLQTKTTGSTVPTALRTPAQAHPAPAPVILPDPPIDAPVTLSGLTAERIEELLRVVPDTEQLVIPSISAAEFEAWRAAADDVYSDFAGRRQSLLRKLIAFNPRSSDGGNEIGDVIVQCVPSAYHESAGRAASAELERAVSGVLGGNARTNGLTCTSGQECSGFISSEQVANIHPTLTKIPDAAITPKQTGWPRLPTTFPTIVVEVGFSQKMDDLKVDAALFLECTNNITQVVLLVELAEASNTTKTSTWPTATHYSRGIATPTSHGNQMDAQPLPSPPSPPAHPEALSQAEKNAMLLNLRNWFFEADGRRALHTPLVGVLDGFMHVYRLRPDADALPAVVCTETIQFISGDIPVPDTVLTLTLADVYGPTHPCFQERLPSTAAAMPAMLRPEESVTVALTPIADEIMEARLSMQQRRALQRAELVMQHHLSERNTVLRAQAALQERLRRENRGPMMENNDPLDSVVIGGKVLRKRPTPGQNEAGGDENDIQNVEGERKWKLLKTKVKSLAGGSDDEWMQ